MITTELQRRALSFILASNRGGYFPKSVDVREWLDRPEPLPGKPGKLIAPAVAAKPGSPSPWMQEFQSTFRSPILKALQDYQTMTQLSGLSAYGSLSSRHVLTPSPLVQMFNGTPGTPARPAKYGPSGPPENVVKQMRRFGWVHRNDTKGLSVSRLGRALYESDMAEQSGSVESGFMVLEAGDELAWGRLVGHIAELDDVLIVDPYLRAEQLSQLREHTSVAKVLIGPNLGNADITALKVLAATPNYEDIEIRQAPRGTLHDRYVIDAISVRLIGASLNGIGGLTTTMVVPLPEEPAALIRKHADEWWEKSTSIGTV